MSGEIISNMLLYPEEGGSRYIRNVRNYKNVDTSKKPASYNVGWLVGYLTTLSQLQRLS
jgi:hypothetical protein